MAEHGISSYQTPHYTVHVEVHRVTPAYETAGPYPKDAKVQVPRVTEDMVNLTVRATTEESALDKAITHLETVEASRAKELKG